MLHSFAKIAFSREVKLVQERYGSREKYAVYDEPAAAAVLSKREIEYIESRDSFYQATVSAAGWPYVQHRGGPRGFLKVLDHKTIGFADYRGNRQYVSVGNIMENNRIALIMVDYVERRRLKIFGHVNILDAADEPELLTQLIMPGYPSEVERAFVIHVHAFSWNCSQHITPRFINDPTSIKG